MTTIHLTVLIVHVLVGASIIGLVLVQRGKGAEAGAAFGAGASSTVFGAKGSANFLSRSTAVLATVFFATSLALAYISSQRPVARSLVEQGGVAQPAGSELSGEAPAGLPALPGAVAPSGIDGAVSEPATN